MDKLEQPTPGNLGENFKKYILYSTPYLFSEAQDVRIVMFGNTGFDINFDPKVKDCTFDFLPEGNSKPVEGSSARYSLMLGRALSELHKFLNNKEELHKFDLDFSKTKVIGASTNESMIKALSGIFSKSENKNLLDINGSMVDINLKEFRDLKDTDPIITYLKQISDRSEGITVSKPF